MDQIGKSTLLMLGAVAAVVAVATFMIYMPQSRQLKLVRTQIVTQEQSLMADSEMASVVPLMLEQVQAMKRQYKDFDRRLPKRQELGGFLREISADLEEKELTGQLIEPGSPASEELFHTLPIIMRFNGSYLSVASFLRSLEDMERFTRIEKLQITRDKKASGSAKLDVELHINIYFTES